MHFDLDLLWRLITHFKKFTFFDTFPFINHISSLTNRINLLMYCMSRREDAGNRLFGNR